MAIDVNKVNNIGTTTPTTLNPDSGSTAISNKPIDLTHNNVKSNTANTEVINYINSKEFKELPLQEQLKQLKERFFPNASTEQVQNYLTEAKQVAAQQDSSTINDGSESSSAALDNSNSVKQTELESSIEKAGLKGDIDEIKAKLLRLEKNGVITEEESQILSQLRSLEQPSKNKSQKTSDKDSSDDIAMIKMVMSDEFRKKTGKEKLTVFMESYLSKNDENFKNLSDKDKQEYISEQMKDLMSVLNLENKPLGNLEKKKAFKDAILLLAASEKKGKSINDYKQMSPEKLQKIIKKEGQERLKQVVNLVPPEKLEGKSNAEKIDTYTDYFLSISDDKYNSLEGKEKDLYRKNKCNEFIEKDLGFKNWSKLPSTQQDKLYKYGVTILCKMAEDGKSIEDFAKLPLAKQTKILINSLSDENKAENADIINELKVKSALIDAVSSDGVKNPKEQDIHNKLLELEKQGVLSPEQKNMLNEYNILKEIGVEFGQDQIPVNSNKVQAKAIGCDVNEYIKNSLDGVNKDNVEDYSKTIKSIVRGAIVDKNIDELYLMRDILKDKGFSDKEINKLIPPRFYNKLQAKGLANNDGKLTAKAINSAMATGDDKAVYSTSQAVKISAKYLKGKELVAAGEAAVQHESLVKPFTESINNREYITKEAAADVSLDILNSDNVSNASKAVFTKEFVTTAAVNGVEEQLYFGEELSKVNNAAVTEGLAAASESIESPQAREVYNSYVDTAAKNYPPEQQAAIQTARQTGEISKATMSQDTPPAASVEHHETQASQVQTGSNSTISNNDNSTSSQGRTTISSNPVSESAVQTNTAQTYKTLPSQTVNANQDTNKTLLQKKEALLEKITSYETAKAERTEARETQKVQNNQKAEEQPDVNVQSSIADSQKTGNAASIESDELQLSEDEQATLKAVIEDIFQKNSVSAAYAKLLDKLGEAGKERFLEAFATKGRDMDVRSFAENYKGNPDTILKLLNYCQSESLKFDLLKMLPSTSISELVSTQKLSSTDFERLVRENKIESKIILEYINKNKGSMSVQEMKKYLSFLSLADRNALFEILKNTKGSDEWLQAQQENMRTVATDSPEYQEELADAAGLGSRDEFPNMDDGLSIGSNKVSMRGQYNKMKKRGPFFMNA